MGAGRSASDSRSLGSTGVMQSFRKILFWVETVVAALFVAWGLFYIAEGVWTGSHDAHHDGMLVVAFGAYLLLEAIPFAIGAAAAMIAADHVQVAKRGKE